MIDVSRVPHGLRRPPVSAARRLTAGALALFLVVTGFLVVTAQGTTWANEIQLAPLGAEYAFFKGEAEPSPEGAGLPTTDWTLPDFDDSTWERGPAGFGYGDQLQAIGTVLDDMSNGYWSVYLRHTFQIDDLDAIEELRFNADYDDGFVAYINGFEVARVGLAGTPPAHTTAATSHESTGTPQAFAIRDLVMLEQGENVLAIQVHNTTLGSSDLVMIPELVANPDFCPETLACTYDLASGRVNLTWVNRRSSYDSLTILRNGEEILSEEGSTRRNFVDMEPPLGEVTYSVIAIDSLNEACPECAALECTVRVIDLDSILVAPGDTWSYFKGTVLPNFGWESDIDYDETGWLTGPTGIGYGDNDDRTILNDMQDSYLAIFTRKIFEVDDPDAVESLLLEVVLDDGMVVYLNGEEVGRVNMPAGDVTELTAATTAADPETFTLELPTDLLDPGENLLAVSVHNGGLGSSDLSFIPTLIAVSDAEPQESFRRGDIDNNGAVNLTDAVSLLGHLFRQQPPPACADAADADDNGSLNLTDAISLLGHLFRQQPPPPAPGLSCGSDPTADALGPCSTSGC